MLVQLQNVDETAIQYATATDFCKIFSKEMHSLYLLSFLLTADKDKAEQCFIGALGECVEGIGAFMEWSRLWARRAIMKQAILMMRPVPEGMDHWSPMSAKGPATDDTNGPFAAILSLRAFERFVFVLSVLEGQSVGDCLSFLRCSRREVEIARELALRSLVTADKSDDHIQEALQAWRTFLRLPQCPERSMQPLRHSVVATRPTSDQCSRTPSVDFTSSVLQNISNSEDGVGRRSKGRNGG